ncbi:MBL fold metallo-hydrolase [Kribbella turkmenica]|uniref:MBL fold metallo-hydrolase n=1 Tax=Kribbella turkmenica TaxID=2530375 RepID=A0A4R4XG81_9ACTN|nr:MBL fold metallo-hydrolase [Kribbella turkmenica]TDD29452.1 MBL fold metallo-hydrolase [Kribbella turkmenica]
MDVTVLCDAVAVFPEPIEEALPGWTPAHAAWTAEVMPGNIQGQGWWLHFHSYLLTGAGGVVLVDAGIGPAGGEAAAWLGVSGRLPALLAKVGVRETDIDTVVLTHVHLDHVGWSTDGEQPRFTNAEYVVQRAELEHVRGGATYERMIRPIVDAGQLRAVDGEIGLRGMRLLPTPGHTPGHQSVLTARAVLAGDVLVHPAQARWPELTYVYERDPARAVTSRREVLAVAAASGIPVVAAHPHAGLTGDVQPLPTPGDGVEVCAPYQLQR